MGFTASEVAASRLDGHRDPGGLSLTYDLIQNRTLVHQYAVESSCSGW